MGARHTISREFVCVIALFLGAQGFVRADVADGSDATRAAAAAAAGGQALVRDALKPPSGPHSDCGGAGAATFVDPCVVWLRSLTNISPLELDGGDVDGAAETLKTNLAPLRAHLPKSGDGPLADANACTTSRVPMLAGKSYFPKFYRMQEGPLWMSAMLGYMAGLPKSTVSTFLAGMQAMKAFRADFDPSLVLAVALRESNSSIFKGPGVVDSHKSGGLDFLGNNLGLLRKGYLPAGYGKNWAPSALMHNESGQACRPALLPANELPVAYGAELLLAKDTFTAAATKYGFTSQQIAAASPTARRAWIALTFGMSGGPEYVEGRRLAMTKLSSPGTVTALTRLKALIDRGQAKGLDDILSSPELMQYTNVRLALASAANAGIIEAHAGLGGQ